MPQYTKVAEANRQYYAKNPSCYEKTSACGKDSEFQQHLEDGLSEVLACLKRPTNELRALDACGGTGNVAVKLLKRGLDVTLTDISREQLAIFEQKCEALSRRARVVCGEIASFLSENPGQFDLIVFSSALHHIEGYTAVLKLCLQALRPGGLVFTLLDPTSALQRKFLARISSRLDYYAFCVWKMLRTCRRPSGGD